MHYRHSQIITYWVAFLSLLSLAPGCSTHTPTTAPTFAQVPVEEQLALFTFTVEGPRRRHKKSVEYGVFSDIGPLLGSVSREVGLAAQIRRADMVSPPFPARRAHVDLLYQITHYQMLLWTVISGVSLGVIPSRSTVEIDITATIRSPRGTEKQYHLNKSGYSWFSLYHLLYEPTERQFHRDMLCSLLGSAQRDGLLPPYTEHE